MPRASKKVFTYEYARPSATVDVALISREANPRVLLIQRKSDPFAGSWALPGGFVEPDERLADAARRELKEETGVTQWELEQLHTFGDPGRDPRGWTISVVFMARVDLKQIKAKAADDASATGWFSLNELPPLAFDHADILQRVIARLIDRQV